MKNLLIAAIFVSFTNTFAQETISINQVIGDNAVFSQTTKAGKTLKYDEIQGSPYLDKNFIEASVAENYIKVPVRYNAFTDEIEFKKDGQTLVLPKNQTFSKIRIVNNNTKLAFLDTKDDLSGYFFELVDGKYGLYKKNQIKFIDEVPAANSYASPKPASFKVNKSVYYLRTPSGFIKDYSPKNLMSQIPDQKDRISDYFKANRSKLNSEADLIKFVNYLNTK